MLMSISFPAIVSEWVELDSRASSSRNEMLGDKHVQSIVSIQLFRQKWQLGLL